MPNQWQENGVIHNENSKKGKVMKTIMATQMIVFVGYQLGDYNIKLILTPNFWAYTGVVIHEVTRERHSFTG